MFDFEKLEVYNNIRELNTKVFTRIVHGDLKDEYLKDQLKRAMMSVMLNLSEGTGRMSTPDKKRFYVTSRSSLFEVVSIMHILLDLGMIEPKIYEDIYADCERASKMLLGMIRTQSAKV